MADQELTIRERVDRWRERVEARNLPDDAPAEQWAEWEASTRQQAYEIMLACRQREERLREALTECRDQLWLLAKDPANNWWVKQADEALALEPKP